jgi:hypothetical protein
VIGNVNTTGTSKQATGVVAAGSYVYYSDFWSGLQIVDASTPTAPVIVGTVHPSGNAADVALSGDLIYLANSGGGLSIIDVSVPASPVLLSTIKPSPGTAQHVSLSGNHAFGAWATYGLEVIDVSDPSAPLDEGILWRGDYLRDVAVQDGMMCALWESTGLTVMQPPCEVVTGVQNNVATGAPTHLLEIVPNPFNPSTSIRFELAAAAPVTLKVFSVTGSLVSTLVPQGTTMTAGWHSVRWNGTNSSGHAVASGTYFARLESRDIVASSRLTLLK